MVSRRMLAVIVVIVSLGLLGPLSFIAEEGAKNTTTATAAPTATPTSTAPVVLGQVLEYTADVTAEIVSVQPVLIAAAVSESDEGEFNATLSQFANASLYALTGSGGRYTATFILDEVPSYAIVLDQLVAANATILSYALPAQIELPPTFTAYRNGMASEMAVSASDEVNALVSGATMSGPANFTLEITKSGSKKSIIALES